MILQRYMFCLMFLMGLSIRTNGQIDYQGKPTYITSKDSIVRVDWIIKSSGKCDVSFDHHINFTNVVDDVLNLSQVECELYRNEKMIHKYIFTTGDEIDNWILESNIKIKKDDNLYFIFKLHSRNKNEKYAFTIYKKKYQDIILAKNEPISVAKQLDDINFLTTNRVMKEKKKPNKFMLGVVDVCGFLLGLD